MRILIAMWNAGGSLPDDEKQLKKIARCRGYVAPCVKDLLIFSNGLVTQKRLAFEQHLYTKLLSKRRRAGEASALKRLNGHSTHGVTNGQHNHSHKEIYRSNGYKNSEVETYTPLETSISQSRARGTTLPADWKPSDKLIAYGENLGLARYQIEAEAETMRLWAEANRNRAIARKANWDATFKGFLRKVKPVPGIGPKRTYREQISK
jgi:hypothetical protein